MLQHLMPIAIGFSFPLSCYLSFLSQATAIHAPIYIYFCSQPWQPLELVIADEASGSQVMSWQPGLFQLFLTLPSSQSVILSLALFFPSSSILSGSVKISLLNPPSCNRRASNYFLSLAVGWSVLLILQWAIGFFASAVVDMLSTSIRVCLFSGWCIYFIKFLSHCLTCTRCYCKHYAS